MTRKDYELIAATIRFTLDGFANEFAKEGVENVARNMASALRNENSRFDEPRFLKACGIAVLKN